MLNSIRLCPIDELVHEFRERNKIRVLQGWLEARANEGNQTPSLHNALAIIYIDINKDPQNFLINNQFYDSKVVGKYCEERNADLAFIAYKRAWGSCDQELVNVTNKNYLYRVQAKYLVERQSEELWAHVLSEENEHREPVIEQVVQIALPESKNPDEVSCAVKAFMDADMPHQLIELLEKIVLHNSDFSENKNLQNLLILTAIKADRTKVMDYVNRLNNFDGDQLAEIALEDKYQLYEEALAIYKKVGDHEKATQVLISHIKNVDTALEYAEKINNPQVWSMIGSAQLDEGKVVEGIDAFCRANDASQYMRVITAAEGQDAYSDLVKYLRMARETQKEAMIDGELIFALAKINELNDLEDFINAANQANVQ